jgi:uncharacterized membrane protein
MKTNIRIKQFSAATLVTIGLALFAPPSFAQQKIAEEMLERQLEKQQQVADKLEKQRKKDEESAKSNREPKDLVLSRFYNRDGSSIR